jgi:histidinol-phosphate aminotransferase
MNVNLKFVEPYNISERQFSDNMVYLDWNESCYNPEPVINYFKNSPFFNYNLYPDPTNFDLIDSLSKYTNTNSNYIDVFNGSDSALDYTFRALLNIGDNVLIPFPNYSQVNQTITSLGCNILYCDIEAIEKSITSEINLIYLSNPNNPIGYCIDPVNLIKKYPNIYFVVDEAYHEYAPEFTLFEQANKFENLIVTRTFSKALCMAALRLGYLTSNLNILEKIRLIKNNKEINRMAQIAGVVTLNNIEWYRNKIELTNKNKHEFVDSLCNVKDLHLFNSNANFILIKHPKIKKIIEESKTKNILIRDRSKFIEDAVRITIGTKESMDTLSKIIKNL